MHFEGAAAAVARGGVGGEVEVEGGHGFVTAGAKLLCSQPAGSERAVTQGHRFTWVLGSDPIGREQGLTPPGGRGDGCAADSPRPAHVARQGTSSRVTRLQTDGDGSLSSGGSSSAGLFSFFPV